MPAPSSLKFLLLASAVVISSLALETDEYSPSSDVKAMYNFPRLEIEMDDDYLNFATRCIAAPAAYCIIGLVAIVIYQLTLCGRFFMRTWTCCGVSKSRTSFRANMMIYFSLILATILMCHMLYIGNQSINDGVNLVADGMEVLENEFLSLSVESQSLVDLASDVEEAAVDGGSGPTACCDTPDCSDPDPSNDPVLAPVFDIFESAGETLGTAGETVYDLVKDIPETISDASDLMVQHMIGSKNVVVFGFYAVGVVICVLFGLFGWMRNKFLTQLMILITEFVLIILTLVNTVFMIILFGLSEYCMDPGVIVDAANETGSSELYTILNYYINCEGESPIGSELDIAEDSLDEILDEINDNSAYFSSGCTAEMDMISTETTAAVASVLEMANIFECTAINSAWGKIVNEGICSEGFTGIYSLWVCLVIVAFLLFAILCIAAIVFKQFELQVEPEEENNELMYDANDQAFLANPGVQMVPMPQQGENFTTYGKVV